MCSSTGLKWPQSPIRNQSIGAPYTTMRWILVWVTRSIAPVHALRWTDSPIQIVIIVSALVFSLMWIADTKSNSLDAILVSAFSSSLFFPVVYKISESTFNQLLSPLLCWFLAPGISFVISSCLDPKRTQFIEQPHRVTQLEEFIAIILHALNRSLLFPSRRLLTSSVTNIVKPCFVRCFHIEHLIRSSPNYRILIIVCYPKKWRVVAFPGELNKRKSFVPGCF